MYFDDYDRDIICPHNQFPANDGHNNFSRAEDSYLGKELPQNFPKETYIPRYPVPKN
jgi:hypothetical protein